MRCISPSSNSLLSSSAFSCCERMEEREETSEALFWNKYRCTFRIGIEQCWMKLFLIILMGIKTNEFRFNDYFYLDNANLKVHSNFVTRTKNDFQFFSSITIRTVPLSSAGGIRHAFTLPTLLPRPPPSRYYSHFLPRFAVFVLTQGMPFTDLGS